MRKKGPIVAPIIINEEGFIMDSIENNNTDKRKKIIKEALEWGKTILIALIIAYVIKAFLFERALVDGNSMNDTLFNNQQLIVYKLGYMFHPPRRGDIVVLEHDPGKYNKYLPLPDPDEVDYVKRVIGVPGDKVDIKNNHVVINNKVQKEPYVKGNTYVESIDFPITVPKNKILVMGDNREESFDSRRFGLISYSRIRGKALFRIFPIKAFGNIYKNMK